IPQDRLSPVAQTLLAYMPATTGTVNNYVSTPPFDSLLYKIDSKVTWVPTNRVVVNGRISGLRDKMNSAGLYGPDNPLSLGTDLTARVFSFSLAMTANLTPNFVVDMVGGGTAPHTFQQPNGEE